MILFMSNSGDFVLEHVKQPQSLINAIKNVCPDYDVNEGVFIKAAEIAKRPRLIKLHLGLPLINPKTLDTAKVRLTNEI